MNELISRYDFSEDAAGLADFIHETMSPLTNSECVVYVVDEDGRNAQSAQFVRETLTDGSTVVNLVIKFV